jgi:predicted component of type VI protein secretion system
MEPDDLRGLLTQLHARLASGVALSGDDRQLLATVLGDIEKALSTTPGAVAPDTSGLESLAVKFEADHPALAGTLRRVVDTLGKAGI